MPLDIDIIKDDIGMPAGDTSDDAWLQRRIEAVIAAFRKYTHRWLYPLAEFTDDWRLIPFEQVALRFPPGRAGTFDGVSNFLKEIPVKEILECKLNNNDTIPPDTIQFNPRTGELTGTMPPGQWSSFPISKMLPMIKYSAGYETLPPDLYDCMIGILTSLWSMRSLQKSGLDIGGQIPSNITVDDVGSVKLGGMSFAGSPFATMGKDPMDPLLGPFTSTLDGYKDYRAIIAGFGIPVCTFLSSDPIVQTMGGEGGS